MFTLSHPRPGIDDDAQEASGALHALSFAISLVVDASGDREAELERSARRATAALEAALRQAAGRPGDPLWGTARVEVDAFVQGASDSGLAADAWTALAVLRSFVDENGDLTP